MDFGLAHLRTPLNIQISSFRRRPESSIFIRLGNGFRRCGEFLEVPFKSPNKLSLGMLAQYLYGMQYPPAISPGFQLAVIDGKKPGNTRIGAGFRYAYWRDKLLLAGGCHSNSQRKAASLLDMRCLHFIYTPNSTPRRAALPQSKTGTPFRKIL